MTQIFLGNGQMFLARFCRLNLNMVSIFPLSRPNILIAKTTNFMDATRKFSPLPLEKIFPECKNVWRLHFKGVLYVVLPCLCCLMKPKNISEGKQMNEISSYVRYCNTSQTKRQNSFQ